MTFGSVFGRTFSPTFQSSSQAVASAASTWWDLNGTITSCIAAYQPIGAASYAASKVNLANPGTYDAVDGAAYPDWAAATGWTAEQAKSEYLDTGITISAGYTIIVRFANAGTGSIVGFYKDANSRYNISPIAAGSHSYHYGNSGVQLVGSNITSGVMALTPSAGYSDGVADLDLSPYTWSGTTSDTFPIFTRRRGDSSGYDSFLSGDILAIAFYNTTLTPAQIALLTNTMKALPGLPKLIAFDGNSMTDTASSSYPATTIAALTGTWVSYNFGVSGQTTIDMIADADSQIDPLYKAGRLNVVVFWEGTNDLKLGATRANAQARIVQYCQERQAVGWKVVVLTILPRTQVGLPETFEDDRIAINTYIRANYTSFADAVADVAGDSRIGDYGDSDNTTYFSDGIHLTTAGYNIVAGIVATAINAL